MQPTRSLKSEKTETGGGVSNNKEAEPQRRGERSFERGKSIGTSLITSNGALLGWRKGRGERPKFEQWGSECNVWCWVARGRPEKGEVEICC